jgi:ABC-type multidrug transport system fused ATPase/permease subunit
MKHDLDASKVFSSMAVFDILRGQLHLTFHTVAQIIMGKVSIDRVNDFLQNVRAATQVWKLKGDQIRVQSELLDHFTEWKPPASTIDNHPEEAIVGFRHAEFTWSEDNGGSISSSRRPFVLRIPEELTFKRGRINLITGPTGSGKTSILMALLGIYCFTDSFSCSKKSCLCRGDALFVIWIRLVVQPTAERRCRICGAGIVGAQRDNQSKSSSS